VGTARIAATPALVGQFHTTAQSLRATLRTSIETATARLREAMAASAGSTTLTAAQSQALLQFKQSFATLHLQYRSDVSTLNALLLVESATGDGEAVAPDADLQVSGTIDAQGQAALRVVLADQSVLQVTGSTAADGSMAGNLAGELAGQNSADLGTWTAAAQAMPAPAPVGNVTAGLAKYTALCASCHTDSVRRNVLNVAAANSVARLDAALAGIGSMTFLQAGMSTQDKLDVVAYILSAR
jgi:mono/diheme cytochrome c family protein